MKGGIKYRFLISQRRDPGISSFLHYARAIAGKGFSRKQISLIFNDLVDPDDYEIGERKALIDYLTMCTNTLNDGGKEHIFRVKERQFGWVW